MAVRLIDKFVNYLDLVALNFTHAKMANTGRLPYNPANIRTGRDLTYVTTSRRR